MPSCTVTVPSPRSVARAAQCSPSVVISTSSASIVPPYVASRPREELFFVWILRFFAVTFAFEPVAKTAFAPSASDVSVRWESVAVLSAARKMAFCPVKFEASALDESPVFESVACVPSTTFAAVSSEADFPCCWPGAPRGGWPCWPFEACPLGGGPGGVEPSGGGPGGVEPSGGGPIGGWPFFRSCWMRLKNSCRKIKDGKRVHGKNLEIRTRKKHPQKRVP